MEFEDVYKNYFHDVFLYARGISQDVKVAEEITQETFFKALKAIDSFDGTSDIRAWLFTIAKNTFYSYCRQKKKCIDLDEIDDQAQVAETFTEKIADKEIAFQIHKFLHDMKEPYKEVFSLRIFGELSFEQIGKIFSKGSGWARVTFYRAKTMIMEYMEEIENGNG